MAHEQRMSSVKDLHAEGCMCPSWHSAGHRGLALCVVATLHVMLPFHAAGVERHASAHEQGRLARGWR